MFAAFLFLAYFLDRFGDKVTQEVVKNPENDLTSLDDTLKALNVTDKQTGQVITADDVVMDWMATMYLNDGSAGDGRYVYHNYRNVPTVSPMMARTLETAFGCVETTSPSSLRARR